MKSCRRAVVALIALWLPLQGVSAVTMPLCRHGLTGAAEQIRAAAAHSSHHGGNEFTAQDGHARHVADAGRIAGNAPLLPCDSCDFCHLCTASTLPAAAVSASIALGGARPDASFPALTGIVLSRLHRPPLLAHG